ncbi:von Willebrand factor A domain-containing protein 5B1 isoform X4 [Zalophus californianus]|uniref:von Willebrand factor A domain-containing protein 5B1 isoform X4 n=1 Tax=Zalophus californianus TaxID=9704 RepID=A0A6P9FCN2_ZALCA|nr:von Willebrand factor A domain-containing protein 5B1 isoform X4 [Zalophus californianus]
MPGLLNQITGAALPLTASDVTSFVSGYALGLTASLTYGNLEAQPFQGLFVYPLDEYTTVIGFEAVIADRVVTVQIKDKAKMDSAHFEGTRLRATTLAGNTLQEGVSVIPPSCTPGKVALDEDLERILFVVNLGTIAPMENVTIFVSTSSELPTLPSGAVRVLLPAVCAPTVPQFCTESIGPSTQQAQSKDKHCFGTRALDSWSKLCLATLLDTDVSNPMEYEFNFQLEIRGPCLLAGVESPTHEIRADAAPSARSAKSIIITLANRHTFDRPVEILIHPSEPHMPHVLMEKGDMTLGEFEQHLKGRTEFIKGMKKDSRAERQTEIIRKRLHKDIPHHSVIMLNFCPDLQSVQPNLRKTHGEFIFLIDRSGSMSGTNIHRVKDAMLVALKSLMPACLFNVIGFGSTFKTLFPSSQTYSEDKRRRCSMLHSQGSSSSVFYHSQDEGPSPDNRNCAKSMGSHFNLRQPKDAQPYIGDSTTNPGLDFSQRRRAYSTNQITNHKPSPRAPTASDPTVPARRYPLRKAKLQDLTNQTSTDAPWWQIDLQPLLNSGLDLSQGPRLRGPGARRPSLLPQGCQPSLPSSQETQTWSPMKEPDLGSSLKAASDSRSPGDPEPSHHPSPFETETSSDWEPPAESEEQINPRRPSTPGPVLGKAVVKGLRDSQRLQWEVTFELGPPGPERGGAHDADLWSETFHHLAARAIIRDFEQLAEREGEIEPGSSRRYQVNAVHTSKACNVISKYTVFVPVDVSKSQYLPTVVGYPNSGAAWRMINSQVLTRQWSGAAAGFGRSQTLLGEDSAAGDGKFQNLNMEESPTAPSSEITSPGREKYVASEGPLRSLATHTLSSFKTSDSLFGSRLNLSKSRLLTRAAKGFLSKPLTKAPESTPGSQSFDYIPLVSLQLASGAFLLNQAFCEAIHIPMEKLKWTSPFTCHRVSLAARQPESKTPSPQLCLSPSAQHPSCDGFSPEPLGEAKPGWEPRAVTEHTGKLWATVVALAWLEHSSASYFVEWELVAAKANWWLERQEVPEGRTRGTLKAAARQLFVLLRHWDENLEFNMLCYNPNYV